MTRIIEILIVVLVLLAIAALVGCNKKEGIQISGCTFAGTSDPNSEIRFLADTDTFKIKNCRFVIDPNIDPNTLFIKIL